MKKGCAEGIIQRIIQNINNLKLPHKLAIIYVITGLIPLTILFIYAYSQMTSILMDRDLKSIKSSLEQAATTADGQIEVYNNLSNYITFNETVSGVLSYDYRNTYEMYNQIVTTFDPMLSSLKYFHDDINRVTIYVDNGIKHDTTLAPIKEIENEPFFETTKNSTQINWFVDKENKTLISARKMSSLDALGVLGIIYIDVDYDSVMSSYANGLDDNCGLVLIDENGHVIGSFNTFDDDNKEYELTDEELVTWLDGADFGADSVLNKNDYSFMRKTSAATGWTAYVYEPRSLVLKSTNIIIVMLILAMLVAVAGAVVASIFTSDFITKRIRKLQESMAKVESGDFDACLHTEDTDEIGELIQGFNSMTTQTKNLITEVYEGRISQKESEMRALRAQINPHFLYNSLSLINWKAIEYEQEDISRITLALSNYYRTSLNKGRNTLTLEQEISNVTSYIQIQQVMHDNSFDVVFDVDEDIMQVESLNLILQPLVENAIDHGIDLLTDKRGVITITGKRVAHVPASGKDSRDKAGLDEIVLTVHDNGVGMDKETCESFLTAESNGYGARNVNDRIRLYYGEEYHLEVESRIGEGTTITIRFPAKRFEVKK